MRVAIIILLSFMAIASCEKVTATEKQCKTAETLAKAASKLSWNQILVCPDEYKPVGVGFHGGGK